MRHGLLALAAGAALAALAPAATAQRIEARPSEPLRADQLVPEGRLRLWYGEVDVDGNGWISFREAEAALRFDRARFRAFDPDRDGRLDEGEFAAYYAEEVASGRRPRPPREVSARPEPVRRTPEQLRAAYDQDLDGRIDGRELERMLADYGQGDIDGAMVLGRLDDDRDGRLALDEMTRLANVLDPILPDGRGERATPAARSLEELFGAQIERRGSQPPRIPGPVPPFRRLDLDNDGFVDLADLDALKGRAPSPVRLASVLHTLDLDEDGRLSEAEFLASLTPGGAVAATAAARDASAPR